MELTERDLHIFLFLKESRFATIPQIARKFWSGEHAYDLSIIRLTKLFKSGYLNKQWIDWLPEPSLYLPTKKSNSALWRERLIKRDAVTDYVRYDLRYSPSILHDLTVTDIRLAFEKTLEIILWITDHELRRKNYHWKYETRTPDGIFKALYHGSRIRGILEYERSRYDRWRYMSVLARLLREETESFIFFVTTTTKRVENLLQIAGGRRMEYLKNRDKVFFSPLKPVLEKGANVAWVNPLGQRRTFELDKLKQSPLKSCGIKGLDNLSFMDDNESELRADYGSHTEGY